MPGCGAAFEGLDDDHAAAVAGTGMNQRFVAIGRISTGRFAFELGDGEQFTGACDVVYTRGFGEQAVVADAMEALRQHMDQEAADELVGGERHQLGALAAFGTIVFPLEGDAIAVESDRGIG